MWMLAQKQIRITALFVEVDGQHFEATRLELAVKRVECGERALAGGTPARPEIDEQDLALVRCQLNRPPIGSLQRDVVRYRLRWRRGQPCRGDRDESNDDGTRCESTYRHDRYSNVSTDSDDHQRFCGAPFNTQVRIRAAL